MRALILAPFAAPYLDRLRRRVDVIYESWLETNTLQDPEALGLRLQREDIQVLVVEADFVFEDVFAAAPGLQLVATCRNALNQIDVDAATAHGVAVTRAPGRNTNAVVELTLAFVLALGRRVPAAHQLVSGGGWRDPALGYRVLRGREIAGATVGVVGFGQIGREVARALAGLRARVIVHDPLVKSEDVRAAGHDVAELNELIGASDFITLHVPDSEGTHHLVNAEFLGKMHRDAYLINTSGGSVVEPNALAEALSRGSIAGAALDVFEGHPLPQSSPLMSAPNLLMTPHIGGATTETIERHSRMICEEIERFLEAQPLLYAVNPEYATARDR
jgi:D-3-phosphoglycerate dehydrogenase